MNAQAETNHDSVGLDSLALIGGTYGISDNLSTSLYYSDVEDAFQKYYGNLNYAVPLAESQSLAFDFNIYQSEYEQEFTNTGSEEDNTIWSLSGAYSFDAHTVTLAYQQSHGGFDGLGYYYGVDGGGTIWLANSVQYSDFNGEDEKSWQVRYDLNMASYGVPGLSFMTRYLTGYDISTPTGEGEEREWDVEAKYVVQEGPAKDLSLRLRHAKYWSDSDYEPINGNDLTDVRLIVQYPLSIM